MVFDVSDPDSRKTASLRSRSLSAYPAPRTHIFLTNEPFKNLMKTSGWTFVLRLIYAESVNEMLGCPCVPTQLVDSSAASKLVRPIYRVIEHPKDNTAK